MELILNDGTIALVDREAFEAEHRVQVAPKLFWIGVPAEISWQAKHRKHTTYVTASLLQKFELRLHRVLLNAHQGDLVDHRDGNGLNNVLSNLRSVTPQGNSANRGLNVGKAFKGIHFRKDQNRWEANIRVNGRKQHLGLFDSDVEAAAAYDSAAIQYFGEFALTNAAIHSGARPSPTGARA